MNLEHLGFGVLASLAYGGVGVFIFAVAIVLMNRLAPFSLRKELEEDQNVSVGIVIASVILGLAMIVAASVHG